MDKYGLYIYKYIINHPCLSILRYPHDLTHIRCHDLLSRSKHDEKPWNLRLFVSPISGKIDTIPYYACIQFTYIYMYIHIHIHIYIHIHTHTYIGVRPFKIWNGSHRQQQERLSPPSFAGSCVEAAAVAAHEAEEALCNEREHRQAQSST